MAEPFGYRYDVRHANPVAVAIAYAQPHAYGVSYAHFIAHAYAHRVAYYCANRFAHHLSRGYGNTH